MQLSVTGRIQNKSEAHSSVLNRQTSTPAKKNPVSKVSFSLPSLKTAVIELQPKLRIVFSCSVCAFIWLFSSQIFAQVCPGKDDPFGGVIDGVILQENPYEIVPNPEEKSLKR